MTKIRSQIEELWRRRGPQDGLLLRFLGRKRQQKEQILLQRQRGDCVQAQR
jgi:hypothetical protein